MFHGGNDLFKVPRGLLDALHDPGARKIDTGPLQQFRFSRFVPLLPHLLEWRAMPVAWCNPHAGHHLLVAGVDGMGRDFEDEMVRSQAGCDVFLELDEMVGLDLKKELRWV